MLYEIICNPNVATDFYQYLKFQFNIKNVKRFYHYDIEGDYKIHMIINLDIDIDKLKTIIYSYWSRDDIYITSNISS